MTPLITAENLIKTYRMGDETVHALDGVSFAIPEGDHVAIIGPSGSGKSTLMNVLGGLDTPDSGHLMINGNDMSALNDSGLAVFRNHTVGFVFQSFNLLPRLTALENVELPMVYAGIPPQERRQRAGQLLDRVGLAARKTHRPTQLSGGQQQRVAIARALSCRPAMLLADEPTGALDTTTTNDILDLFHDLNLEGVTIVVVTHEPEVAAAGKRIIEMRDGKVISDSPSKGRTP